MGNRRPDPDDNFGNVAGGYARGCAYRYVRALIFGIIAIAIPALLAVLSKLPTMLAASGVNAAALHVLLFCLGIGLVTVLVILLLARLVRR